MTAIRFTGEPYAPATRGDLTFAWEGERFTLCRAGEISVWLVGGGAAQVAEKVLSAPIPGFYPFAASAATPVRLCPGGWIHVEQPQRAFGPTFKHYFFPPDLGPPRVALAAGFAVSSLTRVAGHASDAADCPAIAAVFKAREPEPLGPDRRVVDAEGLLAFDGGDLPPDLAEKKRALGASVVRISDLPFE